MEKTENKPRRGQRSVWPVKNRQMSIEALEKLKILTPLQKLPNNLGDLGKLIVA